MPSHTRSASILILILAAAIAVAAFWNMPWWTVDDAFISYRYGKNLVATGELTWSPSLPRVEGYTGILLPMLSAAMLRIGIPMIDGIKVLGILSLLITFWLVAKTLESMGLDRLRQAMAVLLLAASPLVYLHSISGLETIFFTLAITAVMHCLADRERFFRDGKLAIGLAASLLLAAACRPEGIALAVIVAMGILLARKGTDRTAFRKVVVILAGVLLVMGSYWAWRWQYYGAFLPNSFHAKAYAGLVNWESAFALGKFLGYYAVLPLIAAFLLGHPQGWWKRLRVSWLLAIMGTFFLCCSLVYCHSHLWMNYGSRFFFPFLPMLLVGIASMSQNPPELPRPSRIKTLAAVVVMGLQLAVMGFRFHQEWAFLAYYHRIVQDELVPVGHYLKTRLPAGSKIASYMDAGAIGYYSELPIIDFGRLNDPSLTQGTWSTAEVVDYFYLQAADAVVMTSTEADSISYIDEAMAIVSDPRWARYALDSTWSNQVDYPYYQHVFILQQPIP